MHRAHLNRFCPPTWFALILACILGSSRESPGSENAPREKDPDTAVVRATVPDSVRLANEKQARAMYLMDLARRVDVSTLDTQASLTTEEKAYVKRMAARLQPPPEAGSRAREADNGRGKGMDEGKDKAKGKGKDQGKEKP